MKQCKYCRQPTPTLKRLVCDRPECRREAKADASRARARPRPQCKYCSAPVPPSRTVVCASAECLRRSRQEASKMSPGTAGKRWSNPESHRDALSRVMTERTARGENPVTLSHGRRVLAEIDGRAVWFRSTWEVKAAQWMSQNGWRWEYEERWYHVEGLHYLPDFHVYHPADGAAWKIVEVKGYLSPEAEEKLAMFRPYFTELGLPLEVWGQAELSRMGLL